MKEAPRAKLLSHQRTYQLNAKQKNSPLGKKLNSDLLWQKIPKKVCCQIGKSPWVGVCSVLLPVVKVWLRDSEEPDVALVSITCRLVLRDFLSASAKLTGAAEQKKYFNHALWQPLKIGAGVSALGGTVAHIDTYSRWRGRWAAPWSCRWTPTASAARAATFAPFLRNENSRLDDNVVTDTTKRPGLGNGWPRVSGPRRITYRSGGNGPAALGRVAGRRSRRSDHYGGARRRAQISNCVSKSAREAAAPCPTKKRPTPADQSILSCKPVNFS